MAEAAAILRVRHCRADIFCRRPPPRCPACGRPLSGAGLSAAPVRLPSPFRQGHRQPRAFLLRPTAGTFLGGYDGQSDLHVGITNSHGVVYNYNEEGIHRAETGWEQCISIPLVQPDMFGLLQEWDKLLEEFSVGEAWLPHRPSPILIFLMAFNLLEGWYITAAKNSGHSHDQQYLKLLIFCLSRYKDMLPKKEKLTGRYRWYEERDHNCYTYALAFINSVLTAQGKQQMSKSEFTEKFVIPQTKKASKYLTLHQELTANEFYIVPLPDQEKQC